MAFSWRLLLLMPLFSPASALAVDDNPGPGSPPVHASAPATPVRGLSAPQHILDADCTLSHVNPDDSLSSTTWHKYSPLPDLRAALQVMQSSWFQLWLGAWPTAIDWTAAVLHTHLAASLRTLSRSLHVTVSSTPLDENELNAYFAQSSAYYFGEDAFAIRNEAFDDMLWVVLGWLQANRFIDYHSRYHYPDPTPWHGSQFLDAYAHRSRTFYVLAQQGWDTDLCNGGMVWNANLAPYKNAITNQLFISASVGMYLYFTGDDNDSPFVASEPGKSNLSQPHDPQFLAAAVEAYDWLKNVNMTNDKGLYVDGYHLSGWRRNGKNKGLKCDERNEEVYTYNQAVLLSGLRDLWESTGNASYLEDGHKLVRSAIAATGWSLEHHRPSDSLEWSGLGRNGTLEETCDASATCSRDTQSFKGIYFHHLTSFCEPLPSMPLIPGISHGAPIELAALHRQSCRKYADWVEHNAWAALATRSAAGKFGMWWGAVEDTVTSTRADGGQDYKNDPKVLSQPLWGLVDSQSHRHGSPSHNGPRRGQSSTSEIGLEQRDLNDRGRGRTVETQGGGVSVLRAWWEFGHWD